MGKPKYTTIQVEPRDRDEFKAIAEPKGLKLKHVPRLLLEGWRLLSADQHSAACERFERRRRVTQTA